MFKPSQFVLAALANSAAEHAATTSPAYRLFLEQHARQLEAALADCHPAEARAAHMEAEAGYRGLSVAVAYPDGPSTGCLSAARFLISWQAPLRDDDAGELQWMQMRTIGFEGLPPGVLAHVLEHDPDLIPDVIAELVPDDPAAALAAHIASVRAGFN